MVDNITGEKIKKSKLKDLVERDQTLRETDSQRNEMGKIICRRDKIGRTRRVYFDTNSKNGS